MVEQMTLEISPFAETSMQLEKTIKANYLEIPDPDKALRATQGVPDEGRGC